MITADQLRSAIVVRLKSAGLRVVDVVVEASPITDRLELVTVHGVIGGFRDDGAPYTVSARISVPCRARSHPEVTLIPSPFSRSITDKVKTAIWEALEATKPQP